MLNILSQYILKMNKELTEQIELVTHNIEEVLGDEYKKQFIYAIDSIQEKIKPTHILVNIIQLSLNDETKQKQINILKQENKELEYTNIDMKNKIYTLENEKKEIKDENKELNIKIRKQDTKINALNDDIKELKNDIKDLREDNNKKDIRISALEEEMSEFIKGRYNIVLWQTYKNLEYYIIQKATNYDNEKMETINTNLIEFSNNPNNLMFMNEINMLKNKFNIDKYNRNLKLLKQRRIKFSHPEPIELSELKKACNKMKKEYVGIDNLYDAYAEIYDYFD